MILGGPIGAYEDDAYPWLRREAAAVERRLAAERPTLGVPFCPEVASELGAAGLLVPTLRTDTAE